MQATTSTLRFLSFALTAFVSAVACDQDDPAVDLEDPELEQDKSHTEVQDLKAEPEPSAGIEVCSTLNYECHSTSPTGKCTHDSWDQDCGGKITHYDCRDGRRPPCLTS